MLGLAVGRANKSFWRAGPMVPWFRGGGQRVQRSVPGFCRKGCILRCAEGWRGDGNPLESSALKDVLHNPRESVVVRIGIGCKASFCSQ